MARSSSRHSPLARASGQAAFTQIRNAAAARGHEGRTVGAGVGAGLGAMLGSFLGPVGIVAGASLGGLLGGAVGSERDR